MREGRQGQRERERDWGKGCGMSSEIECMTFKVPTTNYMY